MTTLASKWTWWTSNELFPIYGIHQASCLVVGGADSQFYLARCWSPDADSRHGAMNESTALVTPFRTRNRVETHEFYITSVVWKQSSWVIEILTGRSVDYKQKRSLLLVLFLLFRYRGISSPNSLVYIHGYVVAWRSSAVVHFSVRKDKINCIKQNYSKWYILLQIQLTMPRTKYQLHGYHVVKVISPLM